MAKSKAKPKPKPTAQAARPSAGNRCAGAHRRRARAAGAAAGRVARFFRRRRLCLASRRQPARPGQARQPRRDVAAQGHRARARRAGGEHRALRQGAAGQQRAVVGRARHGQVVAGQGLACRGQCRLRRQEPARPAQADRNPPRGHREPARADGADPQLARALHRVLRRPFLRRRRHQLQIAQGAARGRHRGPARQCDLLRHLQPPAPDVARHDGERALDRHQPGRDGGGEGVTVRPLRPLARLPPLQPGRIPRHGRRLCEALQDPGGGPRRLAPRRAGMVDHARRALGARGLAVHPGARRAARAWR